MVGGTFVPVRGQFAWQIEEYGGDIWSSYGGLIGYQEKCDLPSRLVNFKEYAATMSESPLDPHHCFLNWSVSMLVDFRKLAD